MRQGDITTFEGDAIVNAANDNLVLRVGVAGAIRQAGGPAIQEECDRHGPIGVGEAMITGGGKLPVRHVIHAVVISEESASVAAVRQATAAALRLAAEHGDTRLAMPVLGSGVGRIPLREAAESMVDVIRSSPDAEYLDVVVLFGYRAPDAEALEDLLS